MSEFDEVELGPDDEFTGPDLNEEARFGAQCRALRDSEGYKAIMAKMRQITLDTFEYSPMRDDYSRTYCRMMLQVLSDFDANVKDAVDTGRMSVQQLEQQALALKPAPENNR